MSPPSSSRAPVICMLSAAHPPLDKRVFAKEAISLADAGFQVIHLAPEKPAGERSDRGVTLRTYETGRGIRARIRQLARLYKLAAATGADFYHCNEVDSWFVGVFLKLRRPAALVFDVHEHYPSNYDGHPFPAVVRRAISLGIRVVIWSCTPFTDRLVFAKRYIDGDYPAPARKKVLVENFAFIASVKGIERAAKPAEQRAPVTAIHLGNTARFRGWPELLDALAITRNKNVRIEMLGTFVDGSRADFDRRVAELHLEDRVTVVDWMPAEDAMRRVMNADVGLVLLERGLMNHVHALPHKMFDYMLAELPVIVPDFAREVGEIVSDADCGIAVDGDDPRSIAAALDRLADDAVERRRLGSNGRQAVLAKYNWEQEAERLVAMYDDLCRDRQLAFPQRQAAQRASIYAT